MNALKNKSSLVFILYLLFFFSMICAFRAISSISIGLILLTGLIQNREQLVPLFRNNIKTVFFAGCCCFYLVQCTSLFYTANTTETLRHLQLKSGLLAIPLAIGFAPPDEQGFNKLMHGFSILISLALLYCTGIACYNIYFQHSPADVLFYHSLVSPLHQHAVQVSLLVCIAFTYMLDVILKNTLLLPEKIHLLLLAVMGAMIILLSSKLVIACSFLIFCYYSIFLYIKRPGYRKMIVAGLFVLVTTAVIMLSTHNPVEKRFREITTSNNSLIAQKTFDPGNYFNGLQFRLLQWRFVKELLTEQHAWFTGLGAGDAQAALNGKYESTHMYTGDPVRADRGFLGYNTHNQFLESILQSGFPGLLAFILFCAGLIVLSLKGKNRVLTTSALLLLMYAFNEAFFETQYGLSIAVFFPLFIYVGTRNNRDTAYPN